MVKFKEPSEQIVLLLFACAYEAINSFNFFHFNRMEHKLTLSGCNKFTLNQCRYQYPAFDSSQEASVFSCQEWCDSTTGFSCNHQKQILLITQLDYNSGKKEVLKGAFIQTRSLNCQFFYYSSSNRVHSLEKQFLLSRYETEAFTSHFLFTACTS